MKKVKFGWNYMKVGDKKSLVWYSVGQLINFPAGTITIYARDYDGLPAVEGLTIKNETDISTDYFEKDKIRVEPSSPFFPAVSKALADHSAHFAKIASRRLKVA